MPSITHFSAIINTYNALWRCYRLIEAALQSSGCECDVYEHPLKIHLHLLMINGMTVWREMI